MPNQACTAQAAASSPVHKCPSLLPDIESRMQSAERSPRAAAAAILKSPDPVPGRSAAAHSRGANHRPGVPRIRTMISLFFSVSRSHEEYRPAPAVPQSCPSCDVQTSSPPAVWVPRQSHAPAGSPSMPSRESSIHTGPVPRQPMPMPQGAKSFFLARASSMVRDPLASCRKSACPSRSARSAPPAARAAGSALPAVWEGPSPVAGAEADMRGDPNSTSMIARAANKRL